MKAKRIITALNIFLILSGCIIYLYVYLQNRNLIIDEANVARNIYERGFSELLSPLHYEQYAPPVFLWMVKLNSLLFGFGEYALRLYTLLCSLGALVMLYFLFKQLKVPKSAIWFPLTLAILSPLFIRYASELKQYMPDVFITLSLIYLALRVGAYKFSDNKNFIFWMLLGSVAIWASMPSVFILAGIGSAFCLQAFRDKDYKTLIRFVVVGAIWVAQFAIYYFTILEPQANSDYLQDFHRGFFLYATPSNSEEWLHNKLNFHMQLLQFCRPDKYILEIVKFFLVLGAIAMVLRLKVKSLIFLVPVIGWFVAAALNKFSLIPRVSMFGIALLIVIVSYGFAQAFYTRYMIVKAVFFLLGLYIIKGCVQNALDARPFKYEEITVGMNFIQDQNIPEENVHVYWSTIPAFIYYTEMHPQKEHWQNIRNADRLGWDAIYHTLGEQWRAESTADSTKRYGLIFTNATEEQSSERHQRIHNNMDVAAKLEKPYVKAYVYKAFKENL